MPDDIIPNRDLSCIQLNNDIQGSPRTNQKNLMSNQIQMLRIMSDNFILLPRITPDFIGPSLQLHYFVLQSLSSVNNSSNNNNTNNNQVQVNKHEQIYLN